MRIGDNGGEMQINKNSQKSLEEETQETARYYVGVAVASTITKYSLHQLFTDVNETIKNDTALSEILTSPEFPQGVIKFINGPIEEVHLAGLEIVNIFRWRNACKITMLTQQKRPELKDYQNQLLNAKDLKKLILNRKKLHENFFGAYEAWVQKYHPEKASELSTLPL